MLQQQRNLASAENSLIASKAVYAQARAALYQMLAATLQHYGINLNEAVTGSVGAAPLVPGLTPATASKESATAPPAAQ